MNAADIVGGTITEIDCKHAETQDSSDDADIGEVRTIYFYTIVTEKGRADVILHVEHNGYYGGWLNSPTEVGRFPDSATK